METAIVNCKLPVEEVPELFRQAIEGRPLKAKMNRVSVYTPDMGPYLGSGGIVDPAYVIAVDVEPVSAANSQAGGSIIMLVAPDGSGSRVAVVTERWSRLSFSTGLKAIRDGLLERLRTASASREAHLEREQSASPPRRDEFSSSRVVHEVSGDAVRVAEFLASTDDANFNDIRVSCDLTLPEVSQAIKELSAARAVRRVKPGVYRFIGDVATADLGESLPDSELSHDLAAQNGGERAEGRMPEPSGSPISAAERIEKLESAANLLDRGLISPDEFDQLRRELLE